MTEDSRLPILKKQDSLARIHHQIAITDKILAKSFDLQKWWDGLDQVWKEIFLINVELNAQDIWDGENPYAEYENKLGRSFKFKKPDQFQLRQIIDLRELN